MLAIIAEDTALARPLIRHFRLVRPQRFMSLSFYRSRSSASPVIGHLETSDTVLIVSGNHEIEVAASVGYLCGAATESSSDTRSGRSATPIGLIAGVFRFGNPNEPTAPIAVVSRTAVLAGSSDRPLFSRDAGRADTATAGRGRETQAHLPDILYRHALPEIAVETVAGDQSALSGFLRSALTFTGPHRVLAVCAEPGASSLAETSYARTFAGLVSSALTAALPRDQSALDAALATALRIGRSLRLTRSQQHELDRLACEHNSREGTLPAGLSQFEELAPKTKAESSELFAELCVLLGHDGEIP